MEKYRVTLDAEEREALERSVSVGKAASRKLTHARILLLADASDGEGHTDEDIVAALGTSALTIARVRKRFVIEGVHAALDPSRRDRTRSRSRGTSSRGWSSWRARTHPGDGAAGRCDC